MSGWPISGRGAALESWPWSTGPPGLPPSEPRPTSNCGASTETVTGGYSWWGWLTGRMGSFTSRYHFIYNVIRCYFPCQQHYWETLVWTNRLYIFPVYWASTRCQFSHSEVSNNGRNSRCLGLNLNTVSTHLGVIMGRNMLCLCFFVALCLSGKHFEKA